MRIINLFLQQLYVSEAESVSTSERTDPCVTNQTVTRETESCSSDCSQDGSASVSWSRSIGPSVDDLKHNSTRLPQVINSTVSSCSLQNSINTDASSDSPICLDSSQDIVTMVSSRNIVTTDSPRNIVTTDSSRVNKMTFSETSQTKYTATLPDDAVRNEAASECSSGVRAANAETIKSVTQETLCVVCQASPVHRALLPCRHACVCNECFARLITCPMCRAYIISSLNLETARFAR